MSVFTTIVTIVMGILSLILFFKLWFMCDDVKEMKGYLKQAIKDSPETPSVTEPSDSESKQFKFAVGQLVIVKDTEDQFRIDELNENPDGSVLYYSERLDRYYTEDEIEDFHVYWDSKN